MNEYVAPRINALSPRASDVFGFAVTDPKGKVIGALRIALVNLVRPDGCFPIALLLFVTLRRKAQCDIRLNHDHPVRRRGQSPGGF